FDGDLIKITVDTIPIRPIRPPTGNAGGISYIFKIRDYAHGRHLPGLKTVIKNGLIHGYA
ncbi:MAG: hypothetical protein P8107_12110, partial [Spirochaetia bacterium]